MLKAFYLRLAWSNIRRNGKTFFPYILTTAIISGVFLLIAGLIISDGLTNLPTGQLASMIFSFGIVVFGIFAFFFMIYLNNFLIGKRKREFGLYGILGLEKRHVARVLVWENLLTLGAGVICGIVIALVFGRLLFLILIKMIHAVPGSVFYIGPSAYIIMLLLFLAIFVATSLLNLRQVRVSSPIELMSSEKKGEKDSKLLIPLTILGVIALAAAYYYAWSIDSPSAALILFFPLAIIVIISTNILFTSGSIAALRALRANKKLYYKPRNFIAISGMFQRMRQNAKSLATICMLSTMLIVTVSGTLSLYIGQEDMFGELYPYDVSVQVDDGVDTRTVGDFDSAVISLAKQKDVTVTADKDKLVYEAPDNRPRQNNYVSPNAQWTDTPHLICADNLIRFDVDGGEENCLAYMDSLQALLKNDFSNGLRIVSDVFTARQEGYGMYGGLLFLGVFFGILFLAVTVLIIYFKQISEGYEDKAQFLILQKVGMDDAQVKATINRQVLWVFFIPLGMTIFHMVFASKIMARMLETFMLYDWELLLLCIGGTCVLFVLLYLIVYSLTARVYYRIVKW